MAIESLQNVFDRTFDGMEQARSAFVSTLTPCEVGTIISVSTGIATISGLPGVGFEELIEFHGGADTFRMECPACFVPVSKRHTGRGRARCHEASGISQSRW